jgi:hypothetical protein
MSRTSRSSNYGRTFLATIVSAAFFWTLLLSVSPQLHQRIHPDATRGNHTCAVTLIVAGSYDHAVHPPLVSAPELAFGFSKVPVLSSTWVQPLFFGAHIFAHAPPARG